MSDSLPTDLPEIADSKDDIAKVAEQTLADLPPPEIQVLNISFADYIEDKCKIDGMTSKNAQIAIKIVRDIGISFQNHTQFLSKHGSTKLEIKQVFNSSPYDAYYRKLPEEIKDSQEVREIKYVDVNKEVNLRIFYYTLSNIFYMLAITADIHENLNHKPFKASFGKTRRK